MIYIQDKGAFHAPLTTLDMAMVLYMKQILDYDGMFLMRKTHHTVFVTGGM